MPLFEFKCRGCSHDFEALVRPPQTAVTCPSCHSEDVERQLSTFGVSSDGTRERNIQTARKQGEKRAQEKMHADVEWEEKHAH